MYHKLTGTMMPRKPTVSRRPREVEPGEEESGGDEPRKRLSPGSFLLALKLGSHNNL